MNAFKFIVLSIVLATVLVGKSAGQTEAQALREGHSNNLFVATSEYERQYERRQYERKLYEERRRQEEVRREKRSRELEKERAGINREINNLNSNDEYEKQRLREEMRHNLIKQIYN